MKTYIKLFMLGALTLGSLTSCNDFLDRDPLDKVTPPKYFASEADLAAYTIKRYAFTSVQPGQYGISVFGNDNHTDNQAGTGQPLFWRPGDKKVPSDKGVWSWGDVRECNFFFEHVLPKLEAKAITGNESNINHYVGEMYVLRAYAYYKKLVSFGDCPIVTEALPDVEETLIAASKREPRNKVARFILDDLSKAIELLRPIGSVPGGKNRISKEVAQLLRARVALFEGTWEKYHKGTAFVPGGKGWPGNAADAAGYNADTEIAYFLGEAMKDAKAVSDYVLPLLAENKDTDEGMDAKLASINPYYTMFCDINLEPYGEVLMWRAFAVGQATHNIQMELERNGGASGWTRGMVNSFLMRNGLPIYAASSGYDAEWEKQGIAATLQNRDSRILIFTKKPGDINFYKGNDVERSSINYIYGESASIATTGFIVKKGKHYSSDLAFTHHVGNTGNVVFRGAEALLIYMEASYELNNAIDATAEKYWKALRNRAKVDENFNKTISATDMTQEAKGDFGAYSHGQLINETLYNIRRERRNELCGEAMRWEDLKRWRALDQLVGNPYRLEGMLYWGSVYETMPELAEKCKVDPATGTMSDPAKSKYILPYEKVTVNNEIAKQGGFLFTPAHYLEPLGMAVFRQTASDKTDFNTSNVYQNPGWSKEGNTGATAVE